MFFESEAGGVSCQNCRKEIRESFRLEMEDRDLLELIDKLRFTAWERTEFPKDRIKPLNSMVTQFASYHNHVGLPL